MVITVDSIINFCSITFLHAAKNYVLIVPRINVLDKTFQRRRLWLDYNHIFLYLGNKFAFKTHDKNSSLLGTHETDWFKRPKLCSFQAIPIVYQNT